MNDSDRSKGQSKSVIRDDGHICADWWDFVAARWQTAHWFLHLCPRIYLFITCHVCIIPSMIQWLCEVGIKSGQRSTTRKNYSAISNVHKKTVLLQCKNCSLEYMNVTLLTQKWIYLSSCCSKPEFLSFVEHKRQYFILNIYNIYIYIYIYIYILFNDDQNLVTNILQNIPCWRKKMSYGFGTTWRWVKYDRFFICGWTVPSSKMIYY